MKTLIASLLLALPLAAQTTTFQPSVTSSVITGTFTDANGGIYTFSIPYSITLAAGTSTVTYTAPSVAPAPGTDPFGIPGTATVLGLDPLTNWKCTHDAATPGSATCTMAYPVTGLTADNAARAYGMTYSSSGGVRWSDSYASDTAATHFVYDVMVMSPNWSNIRNLELDNNQVTADGLTYIMGTQCSHNSGVWDYTGTSGGTHWVVSTLACDPSKFANNSWHHIRIGYVRDNSGNVTYTGFELDGVYRALGVKLASAKALNWTIGHLVANFQIEGMASSGTITAYTDKLKIVRW